uniref:Paramyosin n=1 Tax=Clastoptera arizonana TaxID=38151 RepID=A0A1B6D977_9HEMI
MNTGGVLLFLVATVHLTLAARGVTNEDIRDAILSFVHMFRDSTDKLERHEFRERQLGEQVKKMLANIDKKQKAGETKLEEIMASIAKLDDRMRNIELKLEQQNTEKEKGIYTVDTIQDSIHNWMTNIESLVNEKSQHESGSINKERIDALEAALNARVDNIAAVMERLESHILRSTPTAVSTQVFDTEAIISRIETKLSQIQPSSQQDWHSVFLGSLANQEKTLLELKDKTDFATETLNSLPNKQDVNQLFNGTRDALQEVKYELEAAGDKGFGKLDVKFDELNKVLTNGQEELHKSISESGVLAEGFYSDVQKSYEQLLKEVKGLAKVEQVMIQTADNVLDTKRRIEYGVHQILLEVGDLVKLQGKDLNNTVNRRFDDISETILDNQNGGLTNLSSKIETEISQVWRQIGIMYQQLTASAGALDRLQQQTEIYVNGSLQTMDSMEGKVGQITGRMSEVDENLNYLLGRLSLVTQEFNTIKTGLGDALDNIRSSFNSVQEKVKKVGPGPNPIDSAENPINDVENVIAGV